MKWAVVFNEKKRSCCPPSFYWVTKNTTIVANDELEIAEKLKKGRYAIEIKKITPYE